jgi:hypothetical protein
MSVLELTRNDSTAWEFTITDADGVAVNITGYVISFTAKARIDDLIGDAVIAVTSATSKVVITDGPDGLCEVRLDPADTDLAPGKYVWDLQVVGGGGTWTVDGGPLYVTADVTTP